MDFNLLFAVTKFLMDNTSTVEVQVFKMAERSDGCSGDILLALCMRKNRLQRNLSKGYYWISDQENINMFTQW